MTTPRRIVLGLGNELCSDDGVGVHAVRALAREPGAAPYCWEIGTAIWHLPSLLLPGDRLLAIDAVAHDGVPGSIYYFEGAHAMASRRASGVHGLGLFELFTMIEPPHRPAHVAVLGVQPASLDYGMHLSPAVASALPRVIDAARAWLNAAAPCAISKKILTQPLTVC